ncbi:MAG TPA: NAD(P)-dependent oxidoreductase [Polyangia bacterium]|nr:NAD(P)-dependent oxidoreductase [Polyangia bacterium]
MGGDLASLADMLKVVKGVDAVVALGGFPEEAPWPTILHANIIGAYNLYEAARRNGVRRVVFASSNHATGFYSRNRKIDHQVYPRPDSRYGLSKVFGEQAGFLYAEKYGLEVFCMRIGNVTPSPVDRRRLSNWLSPRDFAQLVRIGIERRTSTSRSSTACRATTAVSMTMPTPPGWGSRPRTTARSTPRRS